MLIIVIAALMLAAGIGMLIRPGLLFDFLEKESANPGLQVFAVVIRLLFGFLLVRYAATSRFPLAMEILGWLIIVVAAILLLMGRARFQRLLEWVLESFRPHDTVVAAVAIAFGGLLVYAFI